jgi:hypothetical protein
MLVQYQRVHVVNALIRHPYRRQAFVQDMWRLGNSKDN